MTVYNGNRVAYGSGAHYYVQVEITDNGPTTGPTTGLHIWYRIIFENSMSDSMNSITGHDPFGAWDASNQSVNGPGTHLAAFREAECAIAYGGSTANIGFTVSGLGSAGPSSVNVDYPLPARIANTPPSPPTVVVTAIEAHRAYGAVSVPGSDNGSAADYCNYRVLRVSDGAVLGETGGPGIGYSGAWVNGLPRWTNCHMYAQTHNSAGYGGFSAPAAFMTAAEAPSTPPLSADSITTTTARIVVNLVADTGGPAMNLYEAYVMTNNANPGAGGDVVSSATNGTFIATGLKSNTRYFYTGRARNAAGIWSAWTPMQAFTTLPSVLVNDAGTWKNAIPYVNADGNGLPKIAVPYINVAGVWKAQ